jgi:uncharacterized metal-binding protein
MMFAMHTRNHKTTALVFVCSGAADVGELTDRAARQLHRRGIAAMSCLASIAARDQDIIFNADLAERVMLIDGCPKACSRRAFEQASMNKPLLHFDLSEVGLLKGKSPASNENLLRVIKRATEMLAGR